MATRRDIFRNSALISGLVTEQDLAEAEEAALRDADGPPAKVVEVTDAMLAEQLMKSGHLTAYQAEQLRAGRTKLDLGPYVITDWIGQGGMGQVFMAQHRVMGREVAVKVLPQSKSTPKSIESFIREIRLQARLDHPNLVRAYDAGHDGNVHYLVTEYVPGMDLRRYVRSRKRLNMQEAATILTHAAKGLAYAHSQGLVHRDMKPGNLLVTPDGFTKVSDLGLAGTVHDTGTDPRAGRIVGTADYLPPEVIRYPKDVRPVSDIYSLGCTLFYAVTGKVPFPGGSTKDKIRRHLEEAPWHPKRFNPDLSEEFVEIIAEMMEKDPEDRVPTAEEVVARLEPWSVEAAPSPSGQMMGKSPWLAAPPPTDDYSEVVQEMGEQDSRNTDDVRSGDPSSQASYGTEPDSMTGQDTPPQREGRRPPPVITHAPTVVVRERSVALALAVAVPVSLAVGAALMYLVMKLAG